MPGARKSTVKARADQARTHLAEAGERGLSVEQLARILGCSQKQARAALDALWRDFRCWRRFCWKRGCYVFLEPENPKEQG